MIKNVLFVLFTIAFAVQSANAATGLEIDNPQALQVVYSIEPAHLDQTEVKEIVENSLAATTITLTERDDAQLFLRVEQHAGEYLLYLDFSRVMRYVANGKCYRKSGFVWGRYVKSITDTDELHDDIAFLMDEFVELYVEANAL